MAKRRATVTSENCLLAMTIEAEDSADGGTGKEER
jgi:hypothetical protein